MQESSRGSSLLPPSRWFQRGGWRSSSFSHTSLDLTPVIARTGTYAAGGLEWVGGGGESGKS